MTSTIKMRDLKQSTETEFLGFKPVYFVDCDRCSFRSMSVTFDQAIDVKNGHDKYDHSNNIEVVQVSLKDVFSPDQFFTHEKYLLYRTKTRESQPFAPIRRCVCSVCQICWNRVASISSIEDGVFEQVSLTMNCLDCFVICNERKKGW